MTTFGFSAFLKLIHLNDRPQRREVRQRIYPSENGYDFHRSLRSLAARLLHDRDDLADVQNAAAQIGPDAERRSARAAIDQLSIWLAANPAEITAADKIVYESPASVYKVKFVPDFAVILGGTSIGVHIWNTANPELDAETVSGALALFNRPLEDAGLDEIAVLSLRNNQLYRLRNPERYQVLAAAIAQRIERVFNDIRGGGDRPGAEDRPVPH